MEELCDRYPEVFQPNLGKVTGIKAKLHIVPGAIHKFCKTHSVPFSGREAVAAQISKMENGSIIIPVKYSEWAVTMGSSYLTKTKSSVRGLGLG